MRFDKQFGVFDPKVGRVNDDPDNSYRDIIEHARDLLHERTHEQITLIARSIQNKIDTFFTDFKDDQMLFDVLREGEKRAIEDEIVFEKSMEGIFPPIEWLVPLFNTQTIIDPPALEDWPEIQHDGMRTFDCLNTCVKKITDFCSVKGVGKVELWEIYAAAALWLIADSLNPWEKIIEVLASQGYEGLCIQNTASYLIESKEAIFRAQSLFESCERGKNQTKVATIKKKNDRWDLKMGLVAEFYLERGWCKGGNGLNHSKRGRLLRTWITGKIEQAKNDLVLTKKYKKIHEKGKLIGAETMTGWIKKYEKEI